MMRSKTVSAACALLALILLFAAATGNIRYSQIRSGDRQGNGVKVQMAGTISGTGSPICTDAGGNTTTTGCASLHSISFGVDGGGSVLVTGDIHIYPPVDYACTINRIDISGYPSGSITVDVWKAASAIPTSGNKISASAPLTLSSSPLSQAGSLTGWTTSVSVGDVFGFSIASVTTVQNVYGVIWCQ